MLSMVVCSPALAIWSGIETPPMIAVTAITCHSTMPEKMSRIGLPKRSTTAVIAMKRPRP